MISNNAKKILSIQNIACETLGTLENLVLSEGYAIHKVQASRDSIPKSANEFSALIILGGPMSVYEGLSYLGEEQDLIRDAVQREIPTLGICLGSQLIAGALGGTVYKGREKEIGWYDVHITNEGFNSLFRGFEQDRLEVFQWHGDTYSLPVNAEILAFSTLYPQAFRFGSAYGLQFHLEVTSDMILSWMNEYKEEINKEGVGSESIVPNNHNNKINELVGKCRLVWNNFSDVISKSKPSSRHAGSS